MISIRRVPTTRLTGVPSGMAVKNDTSLTSTPRWGRCSETAAFDSPTPAIVAVHRVPVPEGPYLGVKLHTGKPNTQDKEGRFYLALQLFLIKRPPTSTIRALQTQIDEFDRNYDIERDHQNLRPGLPLSRPGTQPRKPSGHSLRTGNHAAPRQRRSDRCGHPFQTPQGIHRSRDSCPLLRRSHLLFDAQRNRISTHHNLRNMSTTTNPSKFVAKQASNP